MRKLSALLAVVAVVVVAACSDTTTLPTGPAAKNSRTPIPATCTTLSALTDLAGQIFSDGGPNAQSVIGKLNDLDKFLQKGDLKNAQSRALDIVSFVQQKAASGKLGATTAQVDVFLGGVLCYAGLLPNTFLIQPTDAAQVLLSNTGNSGISLGANTVNVPTLVTITELDPNGPSGLLTKLDQYPTFITITTSSPLNQPGVVAVCIPASLNVPADVFARLRLGHQKTSGFELTPPADPSFLGCSTSLASSSRLPGWVRTLASFVLPEKLYARTVMSSGGGVGGSSTEFSPFGPVDNGLFAGGGVGGSSTEFQITRDALAPTPGSTAPTSHAKPLFSVYDANGNCISADTTAGTPLSPKCRPLVTVMTAKGTVLIGVPLAWAVTAGGGSIAPANLGDNSCGAFGSTTANATDANGKAAVCWTLGPNAGTNTVQGTPSPGGDAPAGVIFLNGSGAAESGVQFTATGDRIPTTATATGVTVPYDGLPHAGSGTCSNGLSPALSYNSPGGVVPVNVGSYTVTVTCGAGSNVYVVSTATAAISITRRPLTATAGSAVMTYGGTVPSLTCVVSGLVTGDAGTVTCTASVGKPVAGANVTTPVVSPVSPANYSITPVTGLLTVHYVQAGCFEAEEGIFSSPPPTSASQTRGVAVLVECDLDNALGVEVAGATGDLTVTDMGTAGTGPGTLFLHVSNALSPANDTDGDDEYAYTLSTSNMVSGHYYRITAAWDDGTSTVGWIYVVSAPTP